MFFKKFQIVMGSKIVFDSIVLFNYFFILLFIYLSYQIIFKYISKE